MKILVNSINHAPDLTGIGKYTGEMVKWLVESGHEVRVVTAPPYYPEWRISPGYSALLYKIEQHDGARIVRCPLWVPKQPSGLKRIVHLVSFAITTMPVMFWNGLLWRPDMVFLVEPPFSCIPGALLTGWFARARTWLHIQDFEIDAAFDLGILNSESLRNLISRLETWLMRRFDRVSTISLKMLERLQKKGVDASVCLLLENWVETDRIYPLKQRPALHEELGLPENRAIILYSGNMGEKQGLELLIHAAEILESREDLMFLMCGTGSAMNRLKEMAQGLGNVMFIPLQPLDKLNELLNLAHVHLLPQKPGAEDLVMPSKLTNMMASGRPVIATTAKNTQIANVLTDSGVVVESGNVTALCKAIIELIDDKPKASKLGANGRRYAEKHWGINNILSKVFVSI